MDKTWVDEPQLLHTTGVRLEREHSSRFVIDKNYLRLYFQRPSSVIPDPDRPWREMQAAYRFDLQGYNLMRRQVDGALALLCRPLRPRVDPTNAEFETQRGCEKITQFLDGLFDGVEFMAKATEAMRDGALTTVGGLKWAIDDETGDYSCERVDPLSLLWSLDEGREPLHMYQISPVPRLKLRELFPKHRREIEDLPAWQREMIVGVEPAGVRQNESVRVTEGWRLKIGNTAGRHVIACHDLVLLDEEWPFEFFPIAFASWAEDFRQFGGVPLARTVAPYHQIQNRCARKVHDSLNGAVPILMVHEDDDDHTLTDAAFQRVVWRGARPPQITPSNPVSQQLLDYVRDMPNECAAETGISLQASAGMRPAGLNSAPAQREWMDIVSTRLVCQQAKWEQLWRNSARIAIGLAQAAQKKPSVFRKVTAGNVLEEIRWRDIKLDPKDYRVRYDLSSALSLTVSGRLEQLAELKANGAIDQAEYLRQMNMPDVERAADQANAPRDLIERQIDQCLNDGTPAMPMALQNMDDLIRAATAAYQRAEVAGTYPAKNMECLRRLILQCNARKSAPTAANDNAQLAQAPVSGAPPMPQMEPQPAPQVMNG